MAQYCEIAKATTNCTDNCYECLRGETKIRGIEIGDKVRYITEDPEDIKETGYYPPKGTIGTVIGIDSIFAVAPYLIQWPEGTTKWNGRWYVEKENIELVENFDQFIEKA